MKNRLLVLFMMVLCIATSYQLFAQPANVFYTMEAIRHRHNDLTVICAHRGAYVNTNIPENSLLAIKKAAEGGHEMVEIDMKLTSDNVPFLMHDRTLGRCVEGYSPTGNNPATNSVTWNQIAGKRLKTNSGNVSANQKVVRLEDVLEYAKAQNLSMVIMLDIKDVRTAQHCWDVVYYGGYTNAWGTPAYEWVLFKVDPYQFGGNALDMERKMGLTTWESRTGKYEHNPSYYKFKYTPVFNTSQHFNNPSPISVYHDYRWRPYFVGVEIEMKDSPDRQGEVRLGNLKKDVLKTSNDGLVIFQPVAEVAPDKFYRTANGTCCLTLDDYLIKSNPLAEETDQRESLDFIYSEGFTCVITDLPGHAHSFFAYHGKRNLNWLRKNSASRTMGEAMQKDSIAGLNGLAIAPAPQARLTNAVTVYPNPTNGPLTVNIQSDTSGNARIELFDLLGKRVYTQSQPIQLGNNKVLLPNMKSKGFTSSLYMLNVTLPNQQRKTIKVVLQ